MQLTVGVTGLADLQERLANAQDQMKSLPDVLLDVGNLVKNAAEENFPSEGTVLEDPWEPLAASTVKSRERLGYGGESPILVRSGVMKGGFQITQTQNMVTIFNETPYFKYHQSDQPRTHLPQRLMLGLPVWLVNDIVAEFQKYVDQGFSL